jgi:hypothetical protein
MTRDKSGRWTTQGERVESDEGATRWRRTATEVRGAGSSFLARCKKYQGDSKTTNPSKLPVSKKNSAK